MIGRSKTCAGCEVGVPFCCMAVAALSGVGTSSPVVGVEALRVRFNQAPLPLSACPASKKVNAEASEVWSQRTYALTVQVSVALLRSIPRPHSFPCCFAFTPDLVQA